jgi:hypothetical protein
MNIFADDQPPAWLQSRAETGYSSAMKDAGEIGTLGGTGFAALLNMGKKEDVIDPETGKPTGEMRNVGFGQAWTEARLNQENPLWRLKANEMKATYLSSMANLQEQNALWHERSRESSAWMHDSPLMAPYRSATPEQRQTMPPPTATSQRALGMIERIREHDEGYFAGKQAAKVKADEREFAVKNSAENIKRKGIWSDAYNAVTDDDAVEALNHLPNRGMGQDGLPTGPAMAIINRNRKSNGMPPVGEIREAILQERTRHDKAVESNPEKIQEKITARAIEVERLKQQGRSKGLTTIEQADVDIKKKLLDRKAQALGAATGENSRNRITEEINALGDEIMEIYRNAGGDAAPAAAPPGPSPFKEGQSVRNNKDGKIYRIVNGKPVLVEGQ